MLINILFFNLNSHEIVHTFTATNNSQLETQFTTNATFQTLVDIAIKFNTSKLNICSSSLINQYISPKAF